MAGPLVSLALAALVPLACDDPADPPIPSYDATEAEPRVEARLDGLRDVVRLSPDSAAAWGRLALSLQAHGFPEAAVEAYAAARDLRPAEFAYSYLPAAMLGDRRDPRAGSLFAAARRIRPDYAPLLLREADWRLAAGEPAEARSILEDSAATTAEPARADFLLARAELALGDTAGAMERLESAVRSEPAFGDAHAQLAELYRVAGDTTAAALARQRAAAYPDAPPIEDPVFGLVADEGVSSRWHILRGQAHLRAGRPRQASEEFLEATRILPEDAFAALQLGTALEADGRAAEALEAYETALRLRPEMPEAAVNAARLTFASGQPEAARRRLAEVLAADSTATDAWLLLGMFEQASRRPGAAASAYAEGLRRGDFDARLAVRLAWILGTTPDPALRSGRQAVALAERVAAIENFGDAASLDVLAAAYAEFGDFERAVAAGERASTLARQAGRDGLASAIEARTAGYAEGRAYRE